MRDVMRDRRDVVPSIKQKTKKQGGGAGREKNPAKSSVQSQRNIQGARRVRSRARVKSGLSAERACLARREEISLQAARCFP